jgi:endogenous inhibitor of DNA gyrase (YacG/DUF329 family)
LLSESGNRRKAESWPGLKVSESLGDCKRSSSSQASGALSTGVCEQDFSRKGWDGGKEHGWERTLGARAVLDYSGNSFAALAVNLSIWQSRNQQINQSREACSKSMQQKRLRVLRAKRFRPSRGGGYGHESKPKGGAVCGSSRKGNLGQVLSGSKGESKMARVCAREGCGTRLVRRDGTPDYRRHFCSAVCKNMDKRERMQSRRVKAKNNRCPLCGHGSQAAQNSRVPRHNEA